MDAREIYRGQRATRPVYGPGAVHQHNVSQSTLFKEENCGRSEVDSALSTTSWKHERRKQIRQRTVDNAIQQKIAGRMNSIWNYSYLLKRNIGPWGENQYSVTQILLLRPIPMLGSSPALQPARSVPPVRWLRWASHFTALATTGRMLVERVRCSVCFDLSVERCVPECQLYMWLLVTVFGMEN